MVEGLDGACMDLDEMGADLDNAGGMVEMGDGLDGPCTDFDEMGVAIIGGTGVGDTSVRGDSVPACRIHLEIAHANFS